MEYTLIASTVFLGLVACSAIGLSLVLLKRVSGQSHLILKMLQMNSSEVKSAASTVNTVHKTVDQILLHNKASLELSRKTADHHRVLLSSLNRQLVKLETLFERTDSKALSSQQTAAVQSAVKEQLQRERRVSRQPLEREYTTREVAEEQLEENRLQETFADSARQQAPLQRVAPRRVSLRNLVGTETPAPVKNKRRTELLERIFQRTSTTQEETNNNRQNIAKLATLREREALNGSQAKERRVVNG